MDEGFQLAEILPAHGVEIREEAMLHRCWMLEYVGFIGKMSCSMGSFDANEEMTGRWWIPIGTFMFSRNVSNRDGSHEHVPLGGGWDWDAPRQSDNPPSCLVSIYLSRLVNDYHARRDIF